MPPRSTPEDRANTAAESTRRIRRRYKTNLSSRRKLIVGEDLALNPIVAVLKIAGYSHNQIGSIVGLSRGQVGEFLKKPEMQELLIALRQNLAGAAYELLQMYAIEAVQVLGDIMRTSKDDKLRAMVAQDIQDRVGNPKASKQERLLETRSTHSFDEKIVERLRELPADKQEQAAVLIEDLERMLGDEEA